jgi:hypothetical protein
MSCDRSLMLGKFAIGFVGVRCDRCLMWGIGDRKVVVKGFAAFAFFVGIGIALFDVLDFIDDEEIDLKEAYI